MRRRSKLAAIALAIVLATCGGGSLLKSFRVALASSGPLVNSLVSAGAIPQDKATVIIADFDAGAACGLTLQNDFAAIPKDLSEREIRSRKLNASVNGLRCFRTIINRQNFAANKRVQDVANIAEGILASMVVFYSEPGEMRASDSVSVTKARDEKELEEQLKVQIKALERAMKP